MKKPYHNGFTLTELIVAIVVSGIAMMMIGMLITSIYRDWKESNAQAERVSDESIIIGCFDKMVNDLNINGDTLFLEDVENGTNLKRDNNEGQIILSIDNENNKIELNTEIFSLIRVTTVTVIKESNNPKILKLTITFDNETTIENNYCFINEIATNIIEP